MHAGGLQLSELQGLAHQDAAGMRSALATKAVQDMGLSPVCHIEGGFSAWKDGGSAG